MSEPDDVVTVDFVGATGSTGGRRWVGPRACHWGSSTGMSRNLRKAGWSGFCLEIACTDGVWIDLAPPDSQQRFPLFSP